MSTNLSERRNDFQITGSQSWIEVKFKSIVVLQDSRIIGPELLLCSYLEDLIYLQYISCPWPASLWKKQCGIRFLYLLSLEWSMTSYQPLCVCSVSRSAHSNPHLCRYFCFSCPPVSLPSHFLAPLALNSLSFTISLILSPIPDTKPSHLLMSLNFLLSSFSDWSYSFLFFPQDLWSH